MERGQFTEAKQSGLAIAAFLSFDVPCRPIGMMANLNGYGLGLPDSVLTP
jgi:hypothetical protein